MTACLNISYLYESLACRKRFWGGQNYLFSNPVKKGKFSFALLFCLCFLPSFSQKIEVKTQDFNETNGLSTYANFIHKDSRDIIWIGTQFGLYRFDGQDFAHFDEKDGLPFRQIMEIFEDTEGWFWLHKTCIGKPNCQRDLAFFHPLTKEVMTFEERFGDKVSIQTSQIRGIGQDSAKIYFTADKKLLIWSKEAGIREKPISDAKVTPTLWTKVNDAILGAIDFDMINRWQYFRENMHYLAIDTNGMIRQQFQLPSDIKSLDVTRFRTNHFELEKFRVRNLEIGKADDGSLIIDTLDFSLPCCPKNEDYVHYDQNLFTDKQGQLLHSDLGWIKNTEGIYPKGLNISNIFLETKKVWVKEKENPNFFQHFRGEPRHEYFDHETKTTWLALPNGIKAIEFKPQKIVHLNALNQVKQLAISAYVISEHELVLSIQREWFLYNTQTNELKPLPMLSNQEYNHPLRKSGYSVPDKATLWLFNNSPKLKNSRLLKLNTQYYELTVYPKVINKTDFWPSQMIQIDNRFLVGDREGLKWFYLDGHALEAFQQYNEFEVLQTSKVHFFKEYGEEHFWIGSNEGLFLFSKEEGIVARYGEMEEGDFYLPAKDFYHMSEAKEEGYWLATMQGLIFFSADGRRLTVDGEGNEKATTTVKRSDRLPSTVYRHYKNLSTNELLAAYEDDYGFVWMPTPHGLIQFQISSGLSKTYREGEGLSSKSFQEYAHAQMPDGTLVLGSYKGFNVLHPKDFKDVQFNPNVPLSILDFEQYKANADQIEYRLKEVIEKGEIILEPGDKFFNIRVALTDYRDAEKHRFAYKIEGYQDDWQEDKSNWIRISGLPYGEYVLKIKGRLPDGQMAEPGLNIPIHVLRPFYLKSNFIIASLLTFLLMVYLFYKWRTRQLKERQKELEQRVKDRTAQIEKDKLIIEQQAKELRQLDKVKSRFFANVSHELRTPVTLILGPVKSMINSGTLSAKNLTLAKLNLKSAKNLLKLVNEILDLTKMESGKIELEEELVAFHPLLGLLTAAFDGMAKQKQIQYRVEYHADKELWLELDAKKFEKILNNLLSNAFKFTPPNGQITVLVEDRGHHIYLCVEDSGRGIHPDDLPFVFDRFYQSAQPDALKEGGTGIGLSLCMEFAKLMNGSLIVESTLEKGSKFMFEFPKKLAPSTQALTEGLSVLDEVKSSKLSKSPVYLPTEKNRPPANILLVEDNENLREYIQIIIEENYKVTTAENGRVAWEYLMACPESSEVDGRRSMVDGHHSDEASSPLSTDNPKGASRQPQRGKPTTDNRPPDLIISDIMMPEMDGYELLEKLKGSDRFRGIPVIMLTALAELKDKLKALRIGVDDYMVKPFEEEELMARIENLLNNYYSRNQWQQKYREEKEEIEANKPAISVEDTLWLEEVESILKRELSNTKYSVRDLAYEIALSERQLERRLKQFIGLTPKKYFLEIQLQEAKRLFETKRYRTISQVAYASGFSNPKHFSTVFRKHFGVPPSQFFAQQ